jgi:uroporphyrinogen decarboxylase
MQNEVQAGRCGGFPKLDSSLLSPAPAPSYEQRQAGGRLHSHKHPRYSNSVRTSSPSGGNNQGNSVKLQQWIEFKLAAKERRTGRPPIALIVDSPWLPGFLGINHLDYFLDPELWFSSNLRVIEQFPEITFIPSWWIEYGMAIEPSAFGCKVCFYPDHTPDVVPCLKSIEDAEGLLPANPSTDGLMPLALRRYTTQKQRIFDADCTIPFATARGPLCLASFLRGITPLMLDLTENAAAVHRLLDVLTESVIRWLRAQCETIGDCIQGVFVLDDVPGLLSRRLYLEFAHPYMKRVFDAFPKEWVKVYHNDANIKPFAADLPGLGIDVLNWSHKFPVQDAFPATGGHLCLMGNVAPLDLGVHGSSAEVKAAACAVIDAAAGCPLILSLGGGTSPGMPLANVRALIEAVRDV